jgi:hypothetical protein
MDNATREHRLARVTALWAAATNFRRFRTHQQDIQARRNQAKAAALKFVAELLLMTATLAAGLGIYRLTANGPQLLAVATAIVLSFGANSILAPAFTAVFGPTINRLNGLPLKGDGQR